MKIVVLDGYTLNPGDLSWDGFRALGQLTVYDRTDETQTLERVAGADILITNKTALDADTIAQLPRLAYIGVLATGYNVVDIEAAAARDIPVTNIPAYGTRSVAQMVFAHLLNLTQHVADHARTVDAGRWSSSIDFCYWDHPLIELSGLTMGIVGYGKIGRATASIARAFGMDVIAYDVNTDSLSDDEDVRPVDIDTLFSQSDVVSLHCPLFPETAGIVSAERIASMRPTAFLINTSRGALVDEQALADALNNGSIAGAGLDVVSIEPIAPDNPLLHAKNCYITPHIAWATLSARRRLMQTAVDNVAAFLRGTPQNVVNMQA
jgi:glycerate dehydrogenase